VYGEPNALVVAADHWIDVPLDHADPSTGTISVYARELRRHDLVEEDLPYLLFLQGGPGARAPLPGADAPAWTWWALRRYRLILLDQRGTGRSTPMDRWTLPDAVGSDPARQADRLALFRADSIVADAEALRRHLLADSPWTVLGQSFGGFCVWTYLSFHRQGLAAALVTGGIPPVGPTPDQVYLETYRAVQRRTRELDASHPRARAVLAEVARHLSEADERLPNGERLTPARLQETGTALGSTGGIDRLANLADDAWALPGRQLSDAFLAGVAHLISYAGHPLYALLHEAIYAQPGTVTGWSAQRVRNVLGIGEEGEPCSDGASRLPLTGEMIYPHTVERDPVLAPLAPAAHALAERVWDRPLYDRSALAGNTVPVAARIYAEDMFVDPTFSQATAQTTGAVRTVLDTVRHHDGLRRGKVSLLDELVSLLPDAVNPEPRPVMSA
jgi:pimeloyl-ACP methyl ester carboxylesterase